MTPLLYVLGLLAALCIWLLFRAYTVRKNISARCRITKQILKNIDAYVLLADRDFNVLMTNYYMLTGTEETVARPKVGNLLHCKNGDDAGTCGTHELCAICPVRKAIGEAFRTRENFSGLEAPLVLYASADRSSTVECEVSVTGNYMQIDGQDRVLLTIHDITARNRTQRELIKACKRAEESDRMKSLFLANTSHEIRTPLNAIIGFSELLTSDISVSEKIEYVRIIRTNSAILLQLVNDILDLSKVEAGTLEYVFSEEDLNVIMEELEGIFRCRESENPVRIEFERKYPACIVNVDRLRLTQVISNFLSNAVKFTHEGSIRFGYEICDDEYYFYVKDTGAGIPEDKLESIFQRFVKVGSHKQGIGIGLAICKSIVESIGGRIGCESQSGEGSTFWFTVPTSTFIK